MTSPYSGNSQVDAETSNRIDAKVRELQGLENEVLSNLRAERCNLLKKSSEIDDWDVLLTDQLEMLLIDESKSGSEIEALEKCHVEKREELAGLELAMNKSQKQRVEDLKFYENGLSDSLPRFQNAVKTYSNENLKKQIEETKNERQIVKDRTMIVDEEISKFHPEETNATTVLENESAMKEVHQLEALLNKSTSDIGLAIKQTEDTNKILEAKVALNERKINNLSA